MFCPQQKPAWDDENISERETRNSQLLKPTISLRIYTQCVGNNTGVFVVDRVWRKSFSNDLKKTIKAWPLLENVSWMFFIQNLRRLYSFLQRQSVSAMTEEREITQPVAMTLLHYLNWNLFLPINESVTIQTKADS